jgi:hypothetical protein
MAPEDVQLSEFPALRPESELRRLRAYEGLLVFFVAIILVTIVGYVTLTAVSSWLHLVTHSLGATP